MSEASTFLQMAEIRIDDPEIAIRTLAETEDAWRAATVGRRTALGPDSSSSWRVGCCATLAWNAAGSRRWSPTSREAVNR